LRVDSPLMIWYMSFFFFFFFLGPVCISSGSTAAFKAYCAYIYPYWIYIILTHDQWLLLQFLVLLMMDAESVWNM
jgi:soluble lytic murein transglycosylase-like protein